MEIFSQIVSNLGFPIAVAAFLLLRVEKKMEELDKTLMEIMETLLKYRR